MYIIYVSTKLQKFKTIVLFKILSVIIYVKQNIVTFVGE